MPDPQTDQAGQYLPLRNYEYSDHDETKDPLLNGSNVHISNVPSQGAKWMKWASVVVSILAFASVFPLHFASNKLLSRPQDTRGLRHPDMYPGIELEEALSAKGPKMWFPRSIIRASRASPDQVFTTDSHVLLSPLDSMFYQFAIGESPFTKCFIEAEVWPRDETLAANKTYYTSSGDVSAIEVWNVTSPGRLTSLSWNTRPKRIAFMGTVNWTAEPHEDGWQLHDPTPRFPCSKGVYTVEVTCSACRLEFEQVFSSPPLAFDLQVLG